MINKQAFKADGKTPRCQGIARDPGNYFSNRRWIVPHTKQCEFAAKYDGNRYCGHHSPKKGK